MLRLTCLIAVILFISLHNLALANIYGEWISGNGIYVKLSDDEVIVDNGYHTSMFDNHSKRGLLIFKAYRKRHTFQIIRSSEDSLIIKPKNNSSRRLVRSDSLLTFIRKESILIKELNFQGLHARFEGGQHSKCFEIRIYIDSTYTVWCERECVCSICSGWFKGSLSDSTQEKLLEMIYQALPDQVRSHSGSGFDCYSKELILMYNNEESSYRYCSATPYLMQDLLNFLMLIETHCMLERIEE